MAAAFRTGQQVFGGPVVVKHAKCGRVFKFDVEAAAYEPDWNGQEAIGAACPGCGGTVYVALDRFPEKEAG